jgi:hypothetical protein
MVAPSRAFSAMLIVGGGPVHPISATRPTLRTKKPTIPMIRNLKI